MNNYETMIIDHLIGTPKEKYEYLLKLEKENAEMKGALSNTANTFEEENRFVLTTFDGVSKFIDDKVFSVENSPSLIDTIMCLTVSDNITELYPRRIFFSTLEKAEEYIVLNKSCLSIREIAIIIGECNNTTYIDLDILTKKLKNIVESKIN